MATTYTDALLKPDAIEHYGNRRHVIESTGALKVIVKDGHRFVMTPGLGFERGQKVTVAELQRKFWRRVKVINA